jgi:hypothetical protein
MVDLYCTRRGRVIQVGDWAKDPVALNRLRKEGIVPLEEFNAEKVAVDTAKNELDAMIAKRKSVTTSEAAVPTQANPVKRGRKPKIR